MREQRSIDTRCEGFLIAELKPVGTESTGVDSIVAEIAGFGHSARDLERDEMGCPRPGGGG